MCWLLPCSWGGGTYAYLQAETDDVTNYFSTNEVQVALDEDGDREYSIVPGTSEEKDPTVTLTTSVDAYVFVEITDATVLGDGTELVTWAVDSGWTLYTTYEDEYGNTVYVYYCEYYVAEEGTEESVSLRILKDGTVSYEYTLDNDDMAAADEEKDDITLSFVAYAIQMKPFASASTAYAVTTGDAAVVTTAEELAAALESGGTVVLGSSISVDATGSTSSTYNTIAQMTVSEDTVLDLAGYTISFDSTTTEEELAYVPAFISVTNGATLTIEGNGTIDAEAGDNSAYAINVVNGTLIINGGYFYGAPSAVQVQAGGELIVNGGYFDMAASCKAQAPTLAKYVINAIDSAYKAGTATVSMTGGTVVNFDPSNNPEGTGTTYVAEGYTVTSETQTNGDVWYTVVAEEE